MLRAVLNFNTFQNLFFNREESKKILERFYRYQEYDPSQEVQLEKEAKEFDKGTRCGSMSH